MLDRQTYIAAFVDDVQSQPYRAIYRNEPIGEEVCGWDMRLTKYFWPTPERGLADTIARLKPLLKRGEQLSHLPWDENSQREAIVFANDVFAWGGVRPRKEITAESVEAVVRAAISGRSNGAPMNSGWTKVAALVTAHLEREDRSQAIWDSRVSNSLVRRSDRILYDAGHRCVPDWLNGIGKVPGRGGTRSANGQRLRLNWPYAYGRWDSHYAASEIIRKIRDHLNLADSQVRMAIGSNAPWTVRTVEMVLFMDGY